MSGGERRREIRKVLVANRGEIAVRVIRACRELGLRSVAVHSRDDADSAHVRLADEAVLVGPGPAAKSYLHVPNVIQAALMTGADAVHPGYGFLSEDPYFARICRDEGIVFVGPPPEVMAAMGNKATARRLMTAAGLPLLPGTVETVDSLDLAREAAREIGYPVIIKAAAGGGGRGITVVPTVAEFDAAYTATRASALAVFRDSRVYVERYLPRARHIEVQVLADDHGNVVHLGERDCSVQRRHQKLIEEAPSPQVDAGLRAALGEASVAGARAVGYRGAGTMEFLLDAEGGFWFMEMNARIQVEHPVTELVTGVDLVREQLRIAAGEPMSFRQEDVVLRGHAIECRINAEDPLRDFAPTPGAVDNIWWPGGPGVRIDTHLASGGRVSAHYDSLIGKLIVWAPDRAMAIERALRALDELRVEGPGVMTTRDFHRDVLDHPAFREGDVATDFIAHNLRGAA